MSWIDATPTSPVGVWPFDVPGVTNYAQVSPILHRGAQPTADGFQELRRRGVRTVVDLREMHSDVSMLEATGPWRYLRMHEWAHHPEDEDVATFLRAVLEPQNQPVFVHCQHGSDRTGYSVGSYRMVVQGWTADQTLTEMHRFGLHWIWFMIPIFLRRMNTAELRRRLEGTPPPHIELLGE